jgi:flavin-dependent dehydrogenase
MPLRKVRRGLSSVGNLAAAGTSAQPVLSLEDGARVAVIGGGPAGSFFAHFLLKMAAEVDLDLSVDIWEPRSFSRSGPGGCNHCGGIVSESLVQILATEGINLPLDVAQRGIESYVVHMDVDSVRIASPGGERRIAALYRGNGPRTGEATPWESFDGFLQRMAINDGARVVRSLVSGIEWRDGLPHLLEADGAASPYELVCIASGVNSNFVGLLAQAGIEIDPPETMRTYICEFRSDPETIQQVLGDSMHVFLLDIPRLEFAALIPKGEFVTMCLLGEDVDEKLVHEFLHSPEVKRCFPVDSTPCVCTCSPLINVRGPKRPFADRIVLIGDSGVTRLYKDGIGAALRTAKAAATTAVFQGIAAEDFGRHYAPTCEAIAADNAIGKFMFTVTHVFKYARFSRRAIARMSRNEQARPGSARRLSSVLWNMFTGSAPYREILKDTLHPAFLTGMTWNLLLGARPRRRGSKVV